MITEAWREEQHSAHGGIQLYIDNALRAKQYSLQVDTFICTDTSANEIDLYLAHAEWPRLDVSVAARCYICIDFQSCHLFIEKNILFKDLHQLAGADCNYKQVFLSGGRPIYFIQLHEMLHYPSLSLDNPFNKKQTTSLKCTANQNVQLPCAPEALCGSFFCRNHSLLFLLGEKMHIYWIITNLGAYTEIMGAR